MNDINSSGSFSEYINKVRELTANMEFAPMAFVHSYGCQQNVSDGEKILGMLADMGFGITRDRESADVIILNTCAVRENAEEKVFGNVGELKHLKEKNPDLIIGICGCMPQQKHIVERIKRSYKYVDIVFGTFAVPEFPKLLFERMISGNYAEDTEERDSVPTEGMTVMRSCGYKASVPIMYGCNNFCTYCIVPYVRGREHSREPEDILKEIKGLVNDGCKEIMLLGQNVNSYGKNLAEPVTFSQLLRMINDIDGDFRVRFMTPHPKDATTELIDTIFECDKICRHLHLPLQSGSDRILKAMNRHYDVEKYMKIVDYARSKDPEFSFTTDIIVGFPNETREDFDGTINIIRKVGYDNIYSFIYSKRKGTKAAEMDDKTSDADKSAWFREMLDVQREIAEKNYKRFVGREMTVLFDAPGRRDGWLTGKSDEFIIVEAKGDKSLIGTMQKVKILSSRYWECEGEII